MTTVLITGANRGIGLELSKRYTAAGHTVLACCRAPAEADVLMDFSARHDNLSVHGVHVSDADSVAALAAGLGSRPIDILINNAGTSGPAFDRQTVLEMDYEGWADAFAVNAMAPLRMLQALLPCLRAAEAAKAITITSQMGALSFDMPAAYAYCASKAAVNKIMRLAAIDLRKEGIAIGLIHPGWVQTDMGGPNAAISVDESAAGIMETIDRIRLDETGCFMNWNGQPHDW